MSKQKWDIFRVAAWLGVVLPLAGLTIGAILWCDKMNDLPDQIKAINHKIDKIMFCLNIANGTNHPDLFANEK